MLKVSITLWGILDIHVIMKRDKRQINYNLLTDRDGRSIFINIWLGNTFDLTTLILMVGKVRVGFGLGKVVAVGDWGIMEVKNIALLRIMKDMD
ncbi:MAG: hypothetical protein AMR96_05930 [Candidatus Adiutrix intracellularis]|jgi:transposase|nr:MAG: hypothetical protein AMR96_05930 [Candidatus Adiutrix intracellularis]MDR2826604.1 hypothetical protein [Candidatus Adiutrix intracellularis]